MASYQLMRKKVGFECNKRVGSERRIGLFGAQDVIHRAPGIPYPVLGITF